MQQEKGIVLTKAEKQLIEVIRSLDYGEVRVMIKDNGMLRFRNKLLEQGRCPDAVNELLIKLYRVRRCHHG